MNDRKATIVLHSMKKNKFEVMDITFHNIERYNGLRKMTAEDLGNYGEISNIIHRELWEENKEECYYTIEVEVAYTKNRNYLTGEIDTDVNFDYEVVGKSKEYEEELYEI